MRARGWIRGGIGALALVLLATPVHAQDSAARRGWLGFSYAANDRDGEVAVQIERVYPGSPAARAGVRAGDVVVAWNGNGDVDAALESLRLEPGDTVRLRVRRGTERDRVLTVVASQRPLQLAEVPSEPDAVFGMPRGDWQQLQERMRGQQEELARLFSDSVRFRNFDPDEVAQIWGERFRLDSLAVHADSLHKGIQLLLRDSLGPQLRAFNAQVRLLVPPATSRAVMALGSRGVAGAEFEEMNEGLAGYFGTDDGVLVLRVSSGTPAARAGLQPGDVVLRANGRSVESVDRLREAVARAQGAQNRAVQLEILRRGEREEVDLRWE